MMAMFKQNTEIKPYLTKIPPGALKAIYRSRDLGVFFFFFLRGGGGRSYLNATLGALCSCMRLVVCSIERP